MGARRCRRIAVATIVAVLLVGTSGCDPGPPAPPPVPPTSPAPAGTVRAQLERWVATTAYPWILGRSASTQDTLVWGDHLVRETAAGAGLLIALSSEGRRRVARAHLRPLLEREPSASEVSYWAGWLVGHRVDQLDAIAAGSDEVRADYPADAAWLDHVSTTFLGRPATSSERTKGLSALTGGAPRSDVAVFIAASVQARRWRVAETYRNLGLAPPSGAILDLRVAQLGGAGGNDVVLRAAAAVDRAPARVRVGVVGDSVGFELMYRTGPNLPTTIVLPVDGAGRIACGVLSTDPQYRVQDRQGVWKPIGDGRCPSEVARLESAMLAQGVDVLVWQVGAWEVLPYRNGAGTVLAARSAGLRAALVTEMVRRIDGWAARGVRRVLLPEWACVGPLASAAHRSDAYVTFIRSVLDQVVAARPARAAIAPTPPQVCVNGSPRGVPTREHRVARGQELHWIAGPAGARWGWANWFAPAIADLPGLR